VKKISPWEMKFFCLCNRSYGVHIYFMCWQLCIMEAAVSTLITLSIVSSSWVCDSSCIIGSLKFWNSPYLYVVLNLKCVFVLVLSVTRKYFKSCFLILFEMQNINHSVQSWWKKYVILNVTSVKNVLFFYNSVFPMWNFPQHLSCS
jgi:hypothetical protein